MGFKLLVVQPPSACLGCWYQIWKRRQNWGLFYMVLNFPLDYTVLWSVFIIRNSEHGPPDVWFPKGLGLQPRTMSPLWKSWGDPVRFEMGSTDVVMGYDFFPGLKCSGPFGKFKLRKSLKFLYFIWPSILWGSLCFTGENTNSRRLHITWAESWKCQSQASGLGCIAGYGDECLESQHVGDRGTKIATSFRPSWSIQHRAVYWC